MILEALEQSGDDPKPVVKATYNLSMFPASESNKDVKKRKGSNAYFKLNVDEPFETWQAQLLVRISDKLNPVTLSIEDYDVMFHIPRISPSPLSVSTSDDYELLCECVCKARNFEANIVVQEKPRRKV